MRFLFKMTAIMAMIIGLAVTPVLAKTVEVKMLTTGKSEKMVFEPTLVRINPGDTVRFVAVDKGHNAETIKGFIPEGAEPFKSKAGKDFEVTLTKPGVYGYKCKPHFFMGMVGLIIVGGDTHNLDAINKVKLPSKARARMGKALGGS